MKNFREILKSNMSINEKLMEIKLLLYDYTPENPNKNSFRSGEFDLEILASVTKAVAFEEGVRAYRDNLVGLTK